MNKHRNKDRRFSVVEMVLLGFAAPALMGGGFIHAWLKNSQVEVVKDIRKAEQRISDHEGSINSLQVKIEQKLNIYQIRDDLARAGSELTEIPASSVKKISAFSSRGMNEIPETADLAQVRP
jgi:cell division protein FtsL